MRAWWWIPVGLFGGLLLIGAAHLVGVVPSREVIGPVKVHHTFPPRIGPHYQVEHVFEVRNPSRRSVTVLTTERSCGCLEVKLGKSVLGPRDATTMKVVMAVPLSDTPYVGTVELHTDLPQQPVWRYTLQAACYRPVAVVPEVITFGQVAPGSKLARRFAVEVRRFGGVAQRPVEMEVHEPLQGLSIRPGEEPRVFNEEGGIERWLFQWEIDAASGEESGAHRGEIQVAARLHIPAGSEASADAVRATIPVSWIVQGPIVAEPAKVFFGNLASSSGAVSRRVSLRARDGKPFRILRLVSDTELAQASEVSAPVVLQSGSASQSTEAEVEVTLRSDLRQHFFSGKIIPLSPTGPTVPKSRSV